MYDLIAAIVGAFGIVFVAELGDKTQLLAVSFGSRYSVAQVIAGLALGYGAASLVAVAVGGVLGDRLPQRLIEIGGGVVFVVFGLLALRATDEESESDPRRSMVRSAAFVTIGLAILFAEMGDKTQIATATLAARSNPVGTWIGATAGEVASGTIGVLAGSMMGERIRPHALRWISASLFVAFGVIMITGWL